MKKVVWLFILVTLALFGAGCEQVSADTGGITPSVAATSTFTDDQLFAAIKDRMDDAAFRGRMQVLLAEAAGGTEEAPPTEVAAAPPTGPAVPHMVTDLLAKNTRFSGVDPVKGVQVMVHENVVLVTVTIPEENLKTGDSMWSFYSTAGGSKAFDVSTCRDCGNDAYGYFLGTMIAKNADGAARFVPKKGFSSFQLHNPTHQVVVPVMLAPTDALAEVIAWRTAVNPQAAAEAMRPASTT
jgi:hypothetical protein